MHAVLTSMGTDGDVFPFVALGAALRARGHRVTLLANEHFRELALHYGFAFQALVSDSETEELMGNAAVWHPVKSALVGARWAGRMVERQQALLAETVKGNDTVLVAYPPVMAARLVYDQKSCPFVSVVPMPWMIPSVYASPVLSCAFSLPRGTPRPLVRLYWRLLEAGGDLLVGRRINRIRRALHLKPIRRVLVRSLSPQLIIGLFPAWYAPPQPDWPAQMRLSGFPLFDDARAGELPEELLAFCRAGARPITFCFGTGMKHGAQLFRESVEACRRLGARGILLTKFEQQVPDALPSFMHYCPYVSLKKLLPHCAAIVHHGGIGTTAQALASATPQLILPMAWDQPDNAARVRRLGAGRWISPRSSGPRLAAALREVLSDSLRDRCRALADNFGNTNVADNAARKIEGLTR